MLRFRETGVSARGKAPLRYFSFACAALAELSVRSAPEAQAWSGEKHEGEMVRKRAFPCFYLLLVVAVAKESHS